MPTGYRGYMSYGKPAPTPSPLARAELARRGIVVPQGQPPKPQSGKGK